jgi:HD superfamily phosphohydrolase
MRARPPSCQPPRRHPARDCLYDDYIKLSATAVAVLDTEHVQRLRNLKQLSCTYLVYPTAEHSRFAHSLGVSHLAHKALDLLRERQPELDITPQDLRQVELAGLCHDLGHGPFSHLFEARLLPRLGVEHW